MKVSDRFIIEFEEPADDDCTYVFQYSLLDKPNGVRLNSGYIAYNTDMKVVGLETDWRESYKEYLIYKYSTYKMYHDNLAIVSPYIKLTDSICDKIYIRYSVRDSYEQLLKVWNTKEEMMKTLDKIIIDSLL